jgi:beta-glucosidase
MSRPIRTRRSTRSRAGRVLIAVAATFCTTAALGLTGALPAAAESVPYTLPVTLQTPQSAPPVDASAPYTPAVLSLISQIEAPPLTLAEIQNAGTLLHDGSNSTCHNVGPVSGPVGDDASGNPTATTLSAASLVGDTNIKVASITGFTVGETIWVDVTSDAEQVTIASVGTAGATGTGLGLTGALTKAHASGRAVYVTLTTPSITKICWTDAQGVNVTSGTQVARNTAPMTLMGLGATFDRTVGNAWGQTAGVESRELMVSGVFGPQTDLDRLPNWGRNLTTTGEDPYLSHELVAAQINGMQGAHLGTDAAALGSRAGAPANPMSEMKHFVVYNGQNQGANTDIQDQGLHELYMTPYEGGFVDARAAATMCSYQIWRDISTNPLLGSPISALETASPYANPGEAPQTWKLNGSYYSCEHPLSLNYTLRGLWGSAALVGSDYPATHSTSGILQGEDQEMPTANGFFSGGTGTADPTGATCAYFTGNPGGHTAGMWDPNCTSDSSRIGGIPNGFQGGNASAGCAAPATATGSGGCTLNAAVAGGVVSLSVFNQSVARILYQEQRFGMLGCDPAPTAMCTNPGGVPSAANPAVLDRSGTAAIPLGPTSGATPAADLGTQAGDAAMVEKYSEEGATLLKNDNHVLPLTCADVNSGLLVTGWNAQHTIADPTSEASVGYAERNAVNPLEQLKDFVDTPAAGADTNHLNCGATADSHVTYVPVGAEVVGQPVGPTAAYATNPLSTGNTGSPTGTFTQTNPDASTATVSSLDRTTVTSGGTITAAAGAGTYTWEGYVDIPANISAAVTSDSYRFDFEQSANVPTGLACSATGGVTFQRGATTDTDATLDAPFTSCATTGTGIPSGVQALANAASYGSGVPGTPTNAGYTQAGLTNRQTTAATLTPGYYPIKIVLTEPATFTGGAISFRFAFQRTQGDLDDAAAVAAHVSKALVFVNQTGESATATIPGTPAAGSLAGHTVSGVNALAAAQLQLISTVDAVRPTSTAVVANGDNPIDAPWADNTATPHVQSLLEMWFSSGEGGTSTARVLLGLANPSGHTALTWPMNRTDTIWAYPETVPLYPGEAPPAAGNDGLHLERLNGNGGCGGTVTGADACPAAGNTVETEGIYTGYRFFDKENLTPRFPFGLGLSYTTFAYSKLKVKFADDGGLDVSFNVTNTGSVPGADAAQVYLGAPSTAVSGVQFAVRSLSQFTRVQLNPSQVASLTLHVTPRQLSYWSESAQKWMMATGTRTVYVGDADALSNLTQQASITVPATGAVECDNEAINATSIGGDLTVPAGSWCDLVDVSVGGDLTIKSTSGVRIRNSSVAGGVLINGATAAANPQSAGSNVICGTHVTGDLQVLNSGPSAGWNLGGVCGGNTVGGDVQFNYNQAGSSLTGNTIAGTLKCANNGAVTGSGNTAATKKGQCAGF